MERLIIYIAIFLALGCSKNKSSQSDTHKLDTTCGYTSSYIPISFQPRNNWGDTKHSQTKALVTNRVNFINFGIFAYYLPDGEWNSTTETPASDEIPNFMHNQMVIKGSSGWNYSPILYWPSNPNDRIKFFAYAPHSSQREGIVISSNNTAGYPSITFTPATTPTEQRDFMTAQVAPHSKADGVVNFSFKHSLAQLQFCAAHKGVAADKIEIIEIEIQGLRGTATGSFNEDGFVWNHQTTSPETPPKQTVDYKLVTKDDNSEIVNPDGGINNLQLATSNIDDYTNVTSEYGILLLAPQTAKDVKFIVRFKYTNADSDVITFQIFSLSELVLNESKVRYCLFLVDPTNIGMSDITTTTTPWVDKNVNEEDNPWEVE